MRRARAIMCVIRRPLKRPKLHNAQRLIVRIMDRARYCLTPEVINYTSVVPYVPWSYKS